MPTAELHVPYRIVNGAWIAPDGTGLSGGGVVSPFQVKTAPQYAPAPTGGSWASVPVLADAFNPANGLWNRWYPGSIPAFPKLTAGDNSGNGASFGYSSQVSLAASGLQLATTRQPSPVTLGSNTFNYYSGGIETFSDGQSGTIRFLFNPISGKAWSICWEMTMQPNPADSGRSTYGGLDMGIWCFDANAATGIGVWSKIEMDFIEVFGWGGAPLALGPLNIVQPSPQQSFGPYVNSGTLQSTVYDGQRHRYEVMLDNVGNTQHLYIDGTLMQTFAYPSFVKANAANTMCGFAMSNDLRNSDANQSRAAGVPPTTPTWTGTRTTVVHNVAIFTDTANFGTANYDLGAGSPSSALAPGSTLV